jgi:hypothetical protein
MPQQMYSHAVKALKQDNNLLTYIFETLNTIFQNINNAIYYLFLLYIFTQYRVKAI